MEFTAGDWKKDARPLRHVAVRFQARQGRLFAHGSDTKYLAVVSNRNLAPAAVLRWHREKAGTIEHLHDVTKDEIAAGAPLCSRFGANAAWYRLSLLTYDVLSAMKSLALPPQLGSARPKRLRFALFNLAARISSHSGRTLMRVARRLGEFVDLIAACQRLLALTVPPAPA